MTHKNRSKLSSLAGLPTSSSDSRVPLEPYHVRDAMQTLHRAEEIRRDKPLLREVKKMAKAQMKAICK